MSSMCGSAGAIMLHASLLVANVGTGDDCCSDEHSISLQAQVYSIIKDLDPVGLLPCVCRCVEDVIFLHNVKTDDIASLLLLVDLI